MALKVLLADDSAAIKKVVQLCLQDLGVELRSVGSGKDVIDVAKSFGPDIAFVDALLPHKTGYEIASEIKKDSQLSKIPVVMLWSSFMELDEKKFKASGADDKLEKPFEVSGLRSLITKYVPKTQSYPLAKHLEFPKLDFEVSPSVPPRAQATTPLPVEPLPGDASADSWSMASFDDIGTFSGEMEKTQQKQTPETSPPWNGDSEWVRKDLGKFRVPIVDEETEDTSVPFQYSEEALKDTSSFLLKTTPEKTEAPAAPKPQVVAEPSPISRTTHQASATAPSPAGEISLNSAALSEEVKALVEKHVREAIEKVVWKAVPEIATNLIKEEIQRLIGDEK